MTRHSMAANGKPGAGNTGAEGGKVEGHWAGHLTIDSTPIHKPARAVNAAAHTNFPRTFALDVRSGLPVLLSQPMRPWFGSRRAFDGSNGIRGGERRARRAFARAEQRAARKAVRR